MLSAMLRSNHAVQMSIAIVHTFVHMRELMASREDIAARVEKLEGSHDRTASVIKVLVKDIDRLAREVKDMKALPPAPKRRIGMERQKRRPIRRASDDDADLVADPHMRRSRSGPSR